MQVKTALQFLLACGLALAGVSGARAQGTGNVACTDYEAHVGRGKVNMVDFRPATGSQASPFIFRLEFTTFEAVPPDGFL